MMGEVPTIQSPVHGAESRTEMTVFGLEGSGCGEIFELELLVKLEVSKQSMAGRFFYKETSSIVEQWAAMADS